MMRAGMNRKEASPKRKRSRKLVSELVDSEDEQEETREKRVGAGGSASDVENGEEEQREEEDEEQEEEEPAEDDAEEPLPAEVQSFMEQDDASSVLSLILNSIGANSRASNDEDEEASDVSFDQLLYAAVENNSCKYARVCRTNRLCTTACFLS